MILVGGQLLIFLPQGMVEDVASGAPDSQPIGLVAIFLVRYLSCVSPAFPSLGSEAGDNAIHTFTKMFDKLYDIDYCCALPIY